MATARTATNKINNVSTMTIDELRANQPHIVTKLFSATKAIDRGMLDTQLNDWLTANHGKLEVDEIRVLLSSDAEFHCTLIFVIAHWLR